MTLRSAAILVTLAVLGLVAAFGIGVAANAISGDSIGLSARPLRAGDELAPAQAREPADDKGGARTTSTSNERPKTTTSRPTTTPTPTTTTEAGDDHGGRSRGGSGSSGGGDDSGGRGRGRGRGGGDD
jgi:hypothetical protein